jgi:hypothetical protein
MTSPTTHCNMCTGAGAAPDYSKYVPDKVIATGSESLQAPVTWVGYDSSPYAVAKTLVVATMMRRGAETDAILQVGLAACW